MWVVVAGADTELGLGFSEYDTTKAAERGEGINLCNSNNYFSRYLFQRKLSTRIQFKEMDSQDTNVERGDDVTSECL